LVLDFFKDVYVIMIQMSTIQTVVPAIGFHQL